MTPTDPAALAARAIAAYGSGVSALWEFVAALGEMKATGAHRALGHRSLGAWAKTTLGLTPSVTSRYAKIGTWVLTQDDARQARLRRLEVWPVIAALPALRRNPEQALHALEDGATAAQMRAHSAAADPDLHEETEWVTLKLRIPRTVYEELWKPAMYRAYYLAGKDTPTDEDVVTAVSTALLHEPLDGDAERERMVRQGTYHCVECGSWRAAGLERHHAWPRSHGGHEGPLVLLCGTPCHAKVTANIEGTWREYAAKWGIPVPEGI